VEKRAVRNLGICLKDLSDIQRENGDAGCVDGYKEALAMLEGIDALTTAAHCAFSLGHSYKDIGSIRSLSEAEHWYRRSLYLRSEGDHLWRGNCLLLLGTVALNRFRDARGSGRPPEECAGQLFRAGRLYEEAIGMYPPDALDPLSAAQNQLGNVYSEQGKLDLALNHYRESVRYYERQGNRFGAGKTRCNVANALASHGRFPEAREWALAAIRDFEAAGNADNEVVKTLQVLQAIESLLPNPAPQS
jgi:tetratricopeptide (TPR) repeat protein